MTSIPFFVLTVGCMVHGIVKLRRHDAGGWFDIGACVLWLGLAVLVLRKP